MIPLNSPRWLELTHAYGDASDIPELLRRLETFPSKADYKTEPYFSLWSALCHQGDVYSASYAAVPHIVGLLSTAPNTAPSDLFSLVGAIEIARASSHGPEIPKDLADSYFEALRQIPTLAAEAASTSWDEVRCRAIL